MSRLVILFSFNQTKWLFNLMKKKGSWFLLKHKKFWKTVLISIWNCKVFSRWFVTLQIFIFPHYDPPSKIWIRGCKYLKSIHWQKFTTLYMVTTKRSKQVFFPYWPNHKFVFLRFQHDPRLSNIFGHSNRL